MTGVVVEYFISQPAGLTGYRLVSWRWQPSLFLCIQKVHMYNTVNPSSRFFFWLPWPFQLFRLSKIFWLRYGGCLVITVYSSVAVINFFPFTPDIFIFCVPMSSPMQWERRWLTFIRSRMCVCVHLLLFLWTNKCLVKEYMWNALLLLKFRHSTRIHFRIRTLLFLVMLHITISHEIYKMSL